MAYYSRVANYANNNDGAYPGAYYSDTDHYLGDYSVRETSAADYYPDTHANYNSALGQYAAEHGLTTRELQELEDECLRNQAAFESEYQEEMEVGQEV